MSTYEYTIINVKNEIHRGIIQGWTKRRASQQLNQEGISVVTLNRTRKQFAWWRQIIRHISRIERILFMRNLMTMLKAGLNLPEALTSCREQSSNPYLKQIIAEAEKAVMSGQTLSSTLTRYQNVFSPVTVAMIRIGEHGGKLVETLEFLVNHQEGDYRLLRKIRNALVYPALICTTMVAIVVIMMIFVIPRIASLYTEVSVPLPIYTRALIAVSSFIVSKGIYLAAGIIFLIILTKFLLRSAPKFKKIVHRLLLQLPMVGLVIKKLNLAMISRSLHMLTRAGVSIDESLVLASNAATNQIYQEALKSSENFVKRGLRLSDIFKGQPELFLPLFLKMLNTGESTGRLDDMFQHIAQYYDEDIQNWTGNLSTLIEPILLLATGAVVGGIALAVMFPIWNFANII